MMMDQEIGARIARMRDGIARAYGLKPATFSDAVRGAGRRLPRAVRMQLEPALQAEGMVGHPGLLRRLDRRKFALAEARLSAHLDRLDRGAMRRDAVLRWSALVGFYLLAVFGGLLTWGTMTGRF